MRLGDLTMNLENLFISESAPSPQEYLYLRGSLLWDTYSESDVAHALKNSNYCVSIYYNNEIVGTGRVIGDSRLCFYIQDIMVAPSVQRKGVGRIIMNHIMSYIQKNAVEGAYVGLMSKKGKEKFYESFGFVKRPSSTMGNGMVIPHFKK